MSRKVNDMLNPSRFVLGLNAAGVDFFTGVPDSLLKSFCAYVTDTCGDNHVIAANEGGAYGDFLWKKEYFSTPVSVSFP